MATAQKESLMVTDPVCGMRLDPAQASQIRETQGQTFYFCSNYCAELFDPEMTEPELTRLRLAIGQGYQTRLAPAWWVMDRASEAIKKLIDLLFRR